MASAVIVGIGTFFGLLTVLLNSGAGLLSKDNKPFAIFIALVTLVGITLFIYLGKMLFKSFEHVPQTLGIIIICCIFTLPAIQTGYKLKDSYRKFYAKQQTDKYVSQLQDIFLKDNSTLKFDYEQSNYETLYYGDLNRLRFEKTDENTLTTDEIDKLLLSLPLNNKGYRVSIAFGEYRPEYERKISSIAIFLDQNKEPTSCGVDYENYSLCDKYNKE
ncbi:hypothetical protein [Paenibacillus woosongensis]|uniref:Uncharacterized protein n=1 Tax=Paenibacillus woosongensis TaxID=307580 RepID=A0ABQ4MRD6_9BACL|nr:hypothetical protein [Paenibacillus woosongensis]GIP58479.1 hypothetical protein J15TS10_22930 [Paenibacillus woosongensis]